MAPRVPRALQEGVHVWQQIISNVDHNKSTLVRNHTTSQDFHDAECKNHLQQISINQKFQSLSDFQNISQQSKRMHEIKNFGVEHLDHA